MHGACHIISRCADWPARISEASLTYRPKPIRDQDSFSCVKWIVIHVCSDSKADWSGRISKGILLYPPKPMAEQDCFAAKTNTCSCMSCVSRIILLSWRKWIAVSTAKSVEMTKRHCPTFRRHRFFNTKRWNEHLSWQNCTVLPPWGLRGNKSNQMLRNNVECCSVTRKSSTWMDRTASHASGKTDANIKDFLTQGNKRVLLSWFGEPLHNTVHQVWFELWAGKIPWSTGRPCNTVCFRLKII